MQESGLVICRMDLFGTGIGHFYTDYLQELLERFPQLEFPHKQDFYMLLYVEEANGEVIIDHDRIRLDSTKVIIIRPHCISQIDINRQAKGRIICFTEDFFSLRYNNNVLYQFSLFRRGTRPYMRLNKEQKQRWDTLADLLSQEFRQGKKGSDKVMRSYLNIILFELERFHGAVGFVKSKNLKHGKIQQFEELIDRHFVEKKLPSEYAMMLHVSPNYLNKICKEETGQTAGDLIRKRIAIEAQRLLYYTQLTVSEISGQLGFDSASYFATFFRKITGVTPEEFRQKQG